MKTSQVCYYQGVLNPDCHLALILSTRQLLIKEDGRGLTWTLGLQSRRLELSPLMDAVV